MKLYREKVYVTVWVVAIICLGFTSCRDFLLVDISSKKVNIITPPDNHQTTLRQIVFRWDLLDGAEKYHFRLVSPSFSNPALEIMDSTTTRNTITLTLPSIGQYEWWVKAKTGTYVSMFDTMNLRIISDTSLANSNIQLISPVANQLIGIRDSVDLLWYPHTLATQYELQVATSPTFNSFTISYQNNSISTDGHRLVNQLGEGLFYWRVRGGNGAQLSNYSETRSFRIDLTPPNQALLVRPVNNYTIPATSPRDTFTWVSSVEAATSKIQFVSDTMSFSGSATFNADLNSFVLTSTIRQALGVNTWFWRVVSFDTALNERKSIWRKVTFL